MHEATSSRWAPSSTRWRPASAFDGKTTASVIAAILEGEPAPISSLLPLAPAAFDDIVSGCLAKDPEERWQTAHDVGLQLRGCAGGRSSRDHRRWQQVD